jgi:hypothetical protein
MNVANDFGHIEQMVLGLPYGLGLPGQGRHNLRWA